MQQKINTECRFSSLFASCLPQSTVDRPKMTGVLVTDYSNFPPLYKPLWALTIGNRIIDLES